ncbi:FMN-linked oxidoreductase [Gyrodon lividus]|nr:FMN-linked oxidoreductase [Gyrodon lividus]
MASEIFSPVALPCSGRIMPNKLTKVALYEHLAKFYGGPPNEYHIGLYTEWAKHDWGMIVTGNVQVSQEHLTLGRDIVVPLLINEEKLAQFKKLARIIHAEDSREPPASPLAVMQLSHVGRQSPNFIGGRNIGVPPLAPSPIPVGSNKRVPSHDGATSLEANATPHPLLRALFQVPREMTVDDIGQVQQAFIRGALAALGAGFDGVQVHCAHGYLLAQFLNPKSNTRTDQYSLKNALRMVHEIVDGIRDVVPKDFIVGIKINSADYVEAGETPSDERVLKGTQHVLDHIRSIAHWGTIDFIEISGGDYESPDFMSTKATSSRQAFFAHFAKKAREHMKTDAPADVALPLILLTGGLRSPAHLQTALDAGHADILGIGRGSILRPDLPAILHERITRAAAAGTSIASDGEPFAHEPDIDLKVPSWFSKVPLTGAGVNIAWYSVRMRRIAESQMNKTADGKQLLAPPLTFETSGMDALVGMWVWMDWNKMIVPAVYAGAIGLAAVPAKMRCITGLTGLL